MEIPNHVKKMFEGVILDFTKINPKFVKTVYVSTPFGSTENYSLVDFLLLYQMNPEDIVGIDIDLNYDALITEMDTISSQIDERVMRSLNI